MKRWLLVLPWVWACSSDAPRSLPGTDGSAAEPARSDASATDSLDAARSADAARDAAIALDGAPSDTSDAGPAHDASTPASPSLPAACPASVPPSHGPDRYQANTGKTAVDAISYTNVGASGAYAQVIDGWSKATGCVGDSDGTLCKTQYRQPKQVGGALAPFDEDMALVLAGPVELYRIGIYSPRAGGWARDAYWDRCSSEGLVFAGNKHWYECAGFVESYVIADGTKESAVPVQFAGSIAAGTEVHVMSDQRCTDLASCGWSGGLPLRGFAGDQDGSKMFVVELRMPLADKTPAYWILPGQVVRSSQYGCNCRGAGSDSVYKGGCGELDVAEILGGVTTSLEATSTLYSLQDITGGGSVTFARPVNESALFVVIFDAPSRQIALRRLARDGFDFASEATPSFVEAQLANQGSVRALR